MHDGAPDPLTALRATDLRPRSAVLKERISSVDFGFVGSAAQRVGVAVLVLLLAVGVGWRLFMESSPPVEASIPFASEAAGENESTPSASDTGGAPGPTSTSRSESVAAVETQPAVEVVPETVVVHIAGAVLEPGLVVGDGTWRIDDAVRAAGGVTTLADLDRINLAAPILDGQRVYVPYLDKDVPALVQADSPVVDVGTPGGVAQTGEPIDLNGADSTAFEQLPGIGPATAAAIISHREEFGPFGTVDALVAVPGIGPATLESLRDYVRV